VLSKEGASSTRKGFLRVRNHDFGGVEAGLPSQMKELMAPRPKTRGRNIGKAI
jgi:hypothetical protein